MIHRSGAVAVGAADAPGGGRQHHLPSQPELDERQRQQQQAETAQRTMEPSHVPWTDPARPPGEETVDNDRTCQEGEQQRKRGDEPQEDDGDDARSDEGAPPAVAKQQRGEHDDDRRDDGRHERGTYAGGQHDALVEIDRQDVRDRQGDDAEREEDRPCHG